MSEAGEGQLPLPVLERTPSPSSRRSKRSLLARLLNVQPTPVRWPSTSSATFDSSLGHPLVQLYEKERPSDSPLTPNVSGQSGVLDAVIVDRKWCCPSPDCRPSHVEEPAAAPLITLKERHRHPQIPSGGDSRHTSRTGCARVHFLVDFFSPRMVDKTYEQDYRKESWATAKPLAIWTALFFITNWVLAMCFIPKPNTLPDKIFLFGYTPSITLPVLFMIWFDTPRIRPVFYQIWLLFSVWGWSLYYTSFIHICGFYSHHSLYNVSCGTKDFMSLFYYACAIPTLALFGLGMHRATSAVGSLAFLILASACIVPVRTTWARNILNAFVYNLFMLYVHHAKEHGERASFLLREQLRLQFEATQEAQISERKTADSKRRMTSYVFHEVRVPLNTALLAAQNMEAENKASLGLESKALKGSLNMMSQVLNDILDFNRMDTGRFDSRAKPYLFHQTMRSIFLPLRMTAQVRNMVLDLNLDKAIDDVARRAMYAAAGEDAETVEQRINANPSELGFLDGDEIRLRQIVSNLASNACKFTPDGGKLSISTRLVSVENSQLTGAELARCQSRTSSPEQSKRGGNALDARSWCIVRIEVTDTGCGIHPREMRDCELFTPFNQTERGRKQGKGTGLGLAIVRQIVELSGGRLGIKSKVGAGTTIWVELPFGIGDGGSSSRPNSRDKQPNWDTDPLSPQLEWQPNTRRLAPPTAYSVKNGTVHVGSRQVSIPASVEEADRPSTGRVEERPAHSVSTPQITSSEGPPAAPNIEAVSSAGPSVLVVDDDALTRLLMERMLVRLGCEVRTAENGQVAVDLIMRRSEQSGPTRGFNVIFMDNQMPVMSGVKAVMKLRAEHRRDFVVGITGNALLDDQTEFLEAGADQVLTKPVYEVQLRTVLKLAEQRPLEGPDASSPR